MDFGIGYFPTHDAVRPGAIARLCEEHGQASLLFTDHTHIPASRESPWPGGAELPRKYIHTYDPLIAAAVAVEATASLRVGTGVLLITERDPIVSAKEIASIDHLSGGGFEFGVGAGWNREEMANHGTNPKTRMRLMAERVDAMKAIWTQDEATYHGEFVNFDRIWSWPKPLQRPHPPVLVGGNGPTVLDRVLAFGDGWIPNYGRGGEIFDRVEELRARADRPIDVQMMGVPADPAVIERCAEAGMSTILRWLPSAGLNVVEAALDDWETAIAEFTGESA